MGGLVLNTLKKLKGLRFIFPSLSMVLANAIGLGETELKSIPWSSGTERSLGFIVRVISSKN